MNSLAQQLQGRDAERRAEVAPFVLVSGGKGGVGKTTLAANLAIDMARGGRRVLLVDLDLGLADVGVLLDLSAGAHVEDALDGIVPFADCVARGPHGLDVLPASSGSEAMAALDSERRAKLLAGLALLSCNYDVVIGDGAAGIGPDALAFAAAADHVLVVTTPEMPALTDAYGLFKALDGYGARTGTEIPTPEVVVNLAAGVEEGRAIAARLRSVCERFLARSPRQAGWLPRSRFVARRGLRQRPFAALATGTAAGAPQGAVTSASRQGKLELDCLRRISDRLERRLQPALRGVS